MLTVSIYMGKSIRKKALIGYFSNENFSFRGFQAYLAGAPNYNFPLYRQLVHEITQTFSKISQEILAIKNELNERCCLPTLSSILEKIQDKEKDKLELVRNFYFANAELTLAQNLLQPTLKLNGKSWSRMKLTLAKVLARKYQQVALYLTLCRLCLLITFANSFNPDKARQNVRPDLDPNCLTPGLY